jgi:hypothetical protein
MLHTFKSRGGSTALLAFLVKSEQEKKKKSKSELASFEKLSSTTSAKVPQRTAFRHKPRDHHNLRQLFATLSMLHGATVAQYTRESEQLAV